MKKRLFAALTALCLLCLASAQAAPTISPRLFTAAKAAVAALAAGEFDRLAESMPFSGQAPSAAEWARFARNFTQLKDVQQTYAVAYWINGWRLAVPAHPPAEGSVEALMLTSDDGTAFNGYKYVLWSQVVREYAASEKVIWDQEYVGAAPKIFN